MQSEQGHHIKVTLSVWLLAAMFAVPFTIGYHVTPITSFYNEIAAFLLGLLAMYPLLVREAWKSLQWPKASIMFLGLILIILLQCALDLIPTRSQALMYACYFIWSVMLMLLGTHHQKHIAIDQILNRLAKGFVLAAWFNVGYVVVQCLYKAELYIPSFMVSSSFGAISQANQFASFMAIAIISLIYLKFSRLNNATPSRTQTILNTLHFNLGLVAFILLLTLSGSRSSWLYLLVMVAFAFWFAFKQADHSIKLTASSLCKLSLLLLPAFLIMQSLVAEFAHEYAVTAAQRFNEFGDSQAAGGLKVRLYMWQQSLQIFMQHPLTGVGFGQTRWFTFSTLDQSLPTAMDGAYENPHNLVMQLLSEVGLIGTLIVLIPLVLWLKPFFKQPQSVHAWWLLSVLGVLGIHSMLEYPMSYAYFLGLAAYLIGLTQKNAWNLLGRTKIWLHYTVVALLGFGLLICIHTFNSYHKLDHWVRVLMQKQFTVDAMDQYYETISWLNQKSLLAAYSYPMFLLAIEFLPIDETGKQAVNQMSLRVLPMPKSAYLQVVYLLQQNKEKEALHAMKLAIQAYPADYEQRLKSVPPTILNQFKQLHSQAKQALSSD